jgi:hypothetical protein
MHEDHIPDQSHALFKQRLRVFYVLGGDLKRNFQPQVIGMDKYGIVHTAMNDWRIWDGSWGRCDRSARLVDTGKTAVQKTVGRGVL